MPKFKITYLCPQTQVEIVTECSCEDGLEVSAEEWAEDVAYTLADKGPYEVEEVQNDA